MDHIRIPALSARKCQHAVAVVLLGSIKLGVNIRPPAALMHFHDAFQQPYKRRLVSMLLNEYTIPHIGLQVTALAFPVYTR